jgi:hypothetical protein
LEVVTMPVIHDAARWIVDEAVDRSGTFLSLYYYIIEYIGYNVSDFC